MQYAEIDKKVLIFIKKCDILVSNDRILGGEIRGSIRKRHERAMARKTT